MRVSSISAPSSIDSPRRVLMRSASSMSCVYSVRRKFTNPLINCSREEPLISTSASRVERKSGGNGTVILLPRTLTRKAETVNPSSKAPPVAETRPPPIVPSNESIWAWFAVNLNAALKFATVQRSLPSSTDTEALLSAAVPITRGSSKVPLMRTATSAIPEEKKSGETPLSTRMFKSPFTVRFCLPAARGCQRAVENDVCAWSSKPRRVERELVWSETND